MNRERNARSQTVPALLWLSLSPTIDMRPQRGRATFDLRTERTRQGDGGLAGAKADLGDERPGDGATGDGPSEQCESRRKESA